ncbi:MAG: hypothetical protein HLX50_14045 [Alteromonadaceae bacterium]|nr:hypothetical protein [Alteromonadaceae bacterium]
MFERMSEAIGRLWCWLMAQDDPSFMVSLVALIISFIALQYNVRTFWLKAGDKVRFNYSVASSIEAEDNYISSITLENLKDKALVIFEIHLKLANGLYLELERYEDSPLVVEPFGVFQKNYDPVIFYSSNGDRVKLDHLLDSRKSKPHVVLSTTNGKQKVKANIPRWTPLGEYFGNVYSGIIQPMRLIHRDKAYGSNVRFLLDIEKADGERECVPIHSEDFRQSRLKNIELTEESLKDKPSFVALIESHLSEGLVNWKNYDIIEFRKEVEQIEGFKDKNPIKPDQVGALQYHIVGRILNWIESWKMSRQNRRRVRARSKPKHDG